MNGGMTFWDWLSWVGHSVAGGAVLGTLMGWFPPIAAFVAFVWYSIQIYESKTFRDWRERRLEAKIRNAERRLQQLHSRKNK